MVYTTLLLVAVGQLLAGTAASPSNRIEIELISPRQAADCYQLVLDNNFSEWRKLPDDLRRIRFETVAGLPVRSTFTDGNSASRYGGWLLDGSDLGFPLPKRIVMRTDGSPQANNADHGCVTGANFSTCPLGSFVDGQKIAGFQICLRNNGWIRNCPAERLVSNGPVADTVTPIGNNPDTAILSPSQFKAGEYGSLGLRDFHVVTQPGGRACLHEGYYYALLMGMLTKERIGRAILWTRSKSLDGPWQKPAVLLQPKGKWEVVDQGTMVKLPSGRFVLMFRGRVRGGQDALYTMAANSPTGFHLPEQAPGAGLGRALPRHTRKYCPALYDQVERPQPGWLHPRNAGRMGRLYGGLSAVSGNRQVERVRRLFHSPRGSRRLVSDERRKARGRDVQQPPVGLVHGRRQSQDHGGRSQSVRAWRQCLWTKPAGIPRHSGLATVDRIQ